MPYSLAQALHGRAFALLAAEVRAEKVVLDGLETLVGARDGSGSDEGPGGIGMEVAGERVSHPLRIAADGGEPVLYDLLFVGSHIHSLS